VPVLRDGRYISKQAKRELPGWVNQLPCLLGNDARRSQRRRFQRAYWMLEHPHSWSCPKTGRENVGYRAGRSRFTAPGGRCEESFLQRLSRTNRVCSRRRRRCGRHIDERELSWAGQQMINWYLWFACMPINFAEAIFPDVRPKSRYLQRWGSK